MFIRTRIADLLYKLLIIVVLIASFIGLNMYISYRREKEIIPLEDDWKYAYQVDGVRTEANTLFIDGWFFQLQKCRNQVIDLPTGDFGLLLERLDPETGYVLQDGKNDSGDDSKKYGILANVESVVRDDINEYFECEYDYSKCGFSAAIKLSKVDMDNGLYRVVFKPNVLEQEAILANAYLYKGKLYYTNPILSMKLDVENTDLKTIVDEGICLASNAEEHCTLYQHGWKLYWIVDEDFDFIDGGTYIQYQLGTTQFDRLPKYRTDNNLYWSDIGAMFEDYEITDLINCGEYRVSTRDIPNGFSVNVFTTGYFENGKWNWIFHTVRPYYDFSFMPDPKLYGYLGDDVAEWLKE